MILKMHLIPELKEKCIEAILTPCVFSLINFELKKKIHLHDDSLVNAY